MAEIKISHDDDLIKTDEGLVFNPYNPLNVKITLCEVQSILSKYDLPPTVRKLELYQRAFVHRSYTKRPQYENAEQNITIVERPSDCMHLSSKSNERLEFLGDGILECVTKLYLYKRFPKENEGFMTEKKIAIVKNEAIGKIALEMGLHKWFIMSKHAELKQTRTNLNKLGCLFESFIGAIFLDFNKMSIVDDADLFKNTFLSGPGFQVVQIFVENVFERHVDWMNLIMNDDNYKNKLQVKIQKEFQICPQYMEMGEHNPETGYHMGVFLCIGQPIHSVSLQQNIPCNRFRNFTDIHQYVSTNHKVLIFLGEGKNKTKKKAEQIACEEAMRALAGF
jgi:dsRNA-specific ribonuclease